MPDRTYSNAAPRMTIGLVLLPLLYIASWGWAFWFVEAFLPSLKKTEMARRAPMSRQRIAGLWIAAVLALAAYCVAYATDVTHGDFVIVDADDELSRNEPFDMKHTWRSEAYRFGGSVAQLLSLPIHYVDRKLRPDFWGHYVP